MENVKTGRLPFPLLRTSLELKPPKKSTRRLNSSDMVLIMPGNDEVPRSNPVRIESLRRGASPEVQAWAQEMRRNPTPTEARLWERLRDRRLEFRFRRQSILRGWIADFWCPAKRLVVEVDGWSHRNKSRRIKDWARDKTLRESFGIETLRFPVERIVNDLENVVEEIRRTVFGRQTSYIAFGRTRDASK